MCFCIKKGKGAFSDAVQGGGGTKKTCLRHGWNKGKDQGVGAWAIKRHGANVEPGGENHGLLGSYDMREKTLNLLEEFTW